MSRDRRGNGIQEVDGSIPFGSTKSINKLRGANPCPGTQLESLDAEFRTSSIHHRSSLPRAIDRRRGRLSAMRRTTRRFAISFASALGAIATYALILAFPEPLFSSVIADGNIRLYGREPFQGSAHELLREVRSRVAKSGIYDGRVQQRVFVAGTPAWYSFFNGPYRFAMARNVELWNAIFLPRLDLQNRQVVHFDGRRADAAEILAHEMTHTLMQRRLGLLHIWRLPWWKREGYASYIGNTKSAPEPEMYRQARSRWAYLIEVRHLTFDQVIALDISGDELTREMSGSRSPN